MKFVLSSEPLSMISTNGFVKAHTCTLLPTDQQAEGLLGGQTYVIPVYQRPLAWSEAQIQRLLDGFWKPSLG